MMKTINGKEDKMMKKFFLLLSVASIAVALSSCTKTQISISDNTLSASFVELVPMRFIAQGEEANDPVESATKATLDGLNVLWTAGDRVAVIDDVNPTVIHEFTAKSTGEKTTLEGEVSAGSTTFYAIYPYSAVKAVSLISPDADGFTSARFVVEVPRSQKAIEGSFDPDANIFGAYATTENTAMRFYAVHGLVKFRVAEDNVKSVTFSATARYMSGCNSADLRFNTTSSAFEVKNVGTGNLPTEFKNSSHYFSSTTFAKEDGSNLTPNTDYYLVMNQASGTPYQDFSVEGTRTGAPSYTLSGSSNLAVSRAKIKNLGTFSNPNAGVTYTGLYADYLAGQDIVIAGKTYNSSNIAAEYIKAGADNESLTAKLGVSSPKILFLDSEGGAFTMTSATSVSSDLVIVSNSDTPVNYRQSQTLSVTSGGSVTFENLNIDLDGATGAMISNAGATEPISSITFSKCNIVNLLNSLFYSSASALADYGPKSVVIDHCKICYASGAKATLRCHNPTTPASTWHSVKVTNNVLYSSSAFINVQMLAVGGTVAGSVLEVEYAHNIMYNIGSTAGFFRFPSFKKVTLSSIIQVIDDDTNIGANAVKLINSQVSAGTHTDSSASDFLHYGSILKANGTDAANFTIADNKDKVGGIEDNKGSFGQSGKNNIALSENPFSSFTASTGAYVLKSDYSAYGPQ